MNDKEWIKEQKNRWLLRVLVKPLAKANEVIGIQGGALKVKIASLPAEGRANAELIRFLSKRLNVPKSDIKIIAGTTAKEKLIIIPKDERSIREIRAALLKREIKQKPKK